MGRRQENKDETRAQEWLKHQGFVNVQRPRSDLPDIVIDGDYAVEVTRLNQRILVGSDKNSKGKEQAWIPLRDQIEKILGGLGPPGNEGRSWFVDCEYDFSKPLPRPKTIAAQVSEVLAPLRHPYDDRVISDMQSRYFDCEKHSGEIAYLEFPHLCLDCGICLELSEFSYHPAKFLLQNVSDGKGILLAEELALSIRNRIHAKLASMRNRNVTWEYKHWWLILVDHVCHAPMQMLSQCELSYIRNQDYDFWTRIVIISSRAPGWHFDVLPP